VGQYISWVSENQLNHWLEVGMEWLECSTNSLKDLPFAIEVHADKVIMLVLIQLHD
jgi:hypothetical protein